MALIAVVIPFFQEEAGLLRRAVESVFSQVGIQDHLISVIVVDDGSPLEATSDLSHVEVPSWAKLDIIQKANGGVSSARNCGLDRVESTGFRYVAFLDSDDWWAPTHLRQAMTALLSGEVFHFANSLHDDYPSFSYFEAVRSLQDAVGQDGVSGVIDGPAMFDILLAECITHTSQVVFKFAAFPHLRFNEGLRRSGEDHLFWLSAANIAPRFSFTMDIMGYRGRGVSVYRNALPRTSPAYTDRLIDALCFRTNLPNTITLDGKRASLNRDMRKTTVDLLALAVLRTLLRRPRRVHSIILSIHQRLPSSVLSELIMAVPRIRTIRTAANRSGD